MKLFDTVKYALLDGITELDAPYACDLHYYLYNLPNHFIYHAKAKEATAELDVWECIGVVQDYEEKYGVAHTPLSDPCAVANMVVYIMGEELLCRIYGDLSEARCLPAEELEEMRARAQQWFEENPDGLWEIWEDLG